MKKMIKSGRLALLAIVLSSAPAQALEFFTAGIPDFQLTGLQYTYTETGANTADLTLVATSTSPFAHSFLDDAGNTFISGAIATFALDFTVHLLNNAGVLSLDGVSTFSVTGETSFGAESFNTATPLISGTIGEMLQTGNTELRFASNDATGQMYDIVDGFDGQLGFILAPALVSTFDYTDGGTGNVSADATTPRFRVPVLGTLPLVGAPVLLLWLRRRVAA